MTDSFLAEIREREFGTPEGAVHLDTARFGLLPRRCLDAVLDTLKRSRDPGSADDEALMAEMRRARVAVAHLIGSSPDAVTLSPNTTWGINLATALVGSGEPGVVVLSEGEFPANVHPWLALEPDGFRVRVVPALPSGIPDEDALLDAVARPGVRALALSAVQFSTGYLADLERLGSTCRRHGVYFCIDGIQAAGVVPLDVEASHVDVLACGGQKWLCSPWGSGFAYVRPELRDAFRPPVVSWLSMKDSQRFEDFLRYRWEFLPNGRKFEVGTLGIHDIAGMARSVELLSEVGIPRIRRHIRDVQAPLLEWLEDGRGGTPVTARAPQRRAGIISFGVRDPDAVRCSLVEAGYRISVREGVVRVSAHLYNTEDEMARLVEHLEALPPGSSG